MFRNIRTQKTPPFSATKQKTTDKPTPITSDTVLGTSATLKGTLTSEGHVRIDGAFDGDISAQGDVTVGNAGKVEGDIKAQGVFVQGIVRGDIDSKRISVQRSGRVWGDLTTSSLTTEDGGFIQGVITMQSEDDEEKVDELLSDLEAEVAEVIEKTSKK